MDNVDLNQNPIFEIKVWKSKNKYELHIFRGSNSSYEKRDANAAEIKYIDDSLYLTDSVNIIKYKIFKYLKIPEEDILLTANCTMNNEEKKTFIQNIFKGKVHIEQSFFKKVFLAYFNKSNNTKENLDLLQYDDALKQLSNITSIPTILNFSYENIHDYKEVISPNPYNNFHEINNKSVISFFDETLLFKFDLIEYVINLYTPNMEIDTVYFPIKEPLNVKIYEEFIKNKRLLLENTTKLDNIVDSYSFYIDLLYFRVIPYSHNIELNMKNIFRIASVDDNLPIIVYRSKYANEYKVNKFSLTKLDEKQLNIFKEQEKRYESITLNRSNETIIFYIKLFDNVFVYLILSSNGSYKIKYKFNKAHNINLQFILNNLKPIQDILYFVDDSRMYVIENDVEIFESKNIEIIDFNTHSSITFKRRINEKVLQKSNVLFDFNKQEKNIIHLRFLEVNNFYNTDSISSLIYKNIELDRIDLIKKIEQYFKVSTEVATSLYEEKRNKLKINVSKKGKNVFAIKSYDTAVNVKINILSDYSVKIITTNTQNIFYQNMIYFYISQLLCNTKVENIKVVKSKEPTTHDQPANDAIDFNDLLDMNDLDDLDIDDLNEFNIDISSPKANIEADVDELDFKEEEEQDYSNSGKKTDYTTFVLERLYKADPELFLWKNTSTNIKNYSSKCGAVNFRQPVVITKEEKEYIDKHHPKSYTGYVKTGSTSVLKERNFYICPKIWCRLSRVTLTEEEYKKNGNRCPAPYNEEALFFPKQGTPDSKNYFINKDGIEAHYPALLNKNKHPKNLELPCCGKKQLKDIPTENKTVKNTSHYVANISNDLLLDKNQYGNLPYVLNLMLNKKSNCIGTIDAKTSCFVRSGVEQNQNSLIAIIEQILKIKSFKSVVSENLLMEHYIFLNNGNTLKAFSNHEYHYDIFNKEKYKEFQKYFINNEEYIEKFNLYQEYEYVKKHDEINEHSDVLVLSIIREYIIFRSFINFKAYITSTEIEKQLEDIQHLLCFECINPKKINFIFLEIEQDEIYFLNPKYFNHNQYLNKDNDVSVILKIGTHYEYISHISQKKKKEEKVSFEYHTMKDLIQSFSVMCKNDELQDIERYVISTDFKWIGYIQKKILNVFDTDRDMIYDTSKKYTYLNSSAKYILPRLHKSDAIKKRYDELLDEKRTLQNLELLTYTCNHVKPEDKSVFETTLYNIALKFIKNSSLTNSLYVLNHEMTNFSKREKQELLSKIIKKIKYKIPESVNENQVYESLMRIPLQQIVDHYKLKLINNDQNIVYLSFHDIMTNKLLSFKENFTNRFKVVNTTIGDYTEDIAYIKLEGIQKNDDQIFSLDVKKLNLTPIRLKKLLVNFHILNHFLTFSNIISIFNSYNKSINAESAISIIRDNILEQYISNKPKLIAKLKKNTSISKNDIKLMSSSVESIFKTIFDKNYNYSIFELEILSNAAGCNVIIVGRETNIVSNGIYYINNLSTDNLLLHYKINEKELSFQMIVDDSNKYFYKQTSFSDNFNKLLEIA
jgi:hypothetical protein